MLCKIWGFHGSDYEECRLLGYKNSVHTSQETHYVSTTESSQLMLCKIWGFHGSDYEECRLLICYAVWLLYESTFRRNVSPPSSRWQESASVLRLLVTANVPSSPILVTLKVETIRPSETSSLTRDTGSNVPEDVIFHNVVCLWGRRFS
jgi:hypothetical protein